MTEPRLTYDEQTGVFALSTTDLHGIERVELFTAPHVGPFNVLNQDLTESRNVAQEG